MLETIDKLETDTKLPKNRGAELLAHVVSDAGQLKVVSSLEARLKEAARILVKEGTMTSVADAWARSGLINEGEFTKPRSDLKKSPAREQKQHTPQPAQPARTVSTQQASTVVVHAAAPALERNAVTGLLKVGVDPLRMANTMRPQDMPSMLHQLHLKLAELQLFDTATEQEKQYWQRGAEFLDAVAGVRPKEANKALFANIQASLDTASKVNATTVKARQVS